MADLLKKLVSFLSARERLQFLAVLCGMVLAAGLEAVGLGLLLSFILILRDGRLPSAGQQVARVLEAIGAASGPGALTRLSVLVLVFYVAKNIYLAWLYRLEFKIVYKKQTALSKRLLRTYLDKPYTFHLQRNTAELLKNVTDEVHAACHNVLVPLLLLISEAMVIAIIVGALMVVDPLVAVSVLVLTAGAGWMVMARIQRTLKAQGQAKQDHLEAMIRWVNQSFGSLKEIKILGRQGSFVETYGASATGFGNSLRFVAMAHQLPRLFIETMAVGFIALTVVLSQWQGREIASIMPLLALFGLAAVRLMPSMGRVASMLTMFQYFKPAVDVVYRDLDRPAAGSPAESPAVPAHPQGRLRVMRLADELALAGVSYHYPGTERFAVKNVSLVIRKGALVGLVGPSGSGKTTILDLILGLLTPSGGRLLVDGRDIHEDLRAWQANIGYVPQIAYILDDSIRRNVALGVADAEIDDEKVWWALRAAQLESFVTSLPDRLDTIVGERGSRLSGGERQRLGIARALYHDPDVLVMDEPTSALDYATEHEVIRVIDAMKGQKTMLVVAHRLSTVRSCDEIYMVRHGRVSGPLQYENVAALARSAGDVR